MGNAALEDSDPTSAGILCIFGSGTFVPRSWTCKKQSSVSHSTTGSEIISLDAKTESGFDFLRGICGTRCLKCCVSPFGEICRIKRVRTQPKIERSRNVSSQKSTSLRRSILSLRTQNDPVIQPCCSYSRMMTQWSRWPWKTGAGQWDTFPAPTESEIISLDAGLRIDGIPASDQWDLVTEVLHSPVRGDSSRSHDSIQVDVSKKTCEKRTIGRTKQTRLTLDGILLEVDHVSPNAQQSRHPALFFHFGR